MFAIVDSNGTLYFQDPDERTCEIELSGYEASGYTDLEIIELEG